MLVEEMAGLNFVERDDNISEEDYVLFSERNSKSWDDASQNIQKLWGTVELESFMYQTVEAVVDSFTDHLSSWHKFGIETMENVFQVLSLSWFFWIEQLQEFLDEGWSNMYLQSFDISSVVYYQL